MKAHWAALLGGALASAAALGDSPCPADGLKVGYYLIGSAYENGHGYDVDLVHELARRLGCKIAQEDVYPRIRVLKMLEHGQLNLGTSAVPTADRRKYSWIYPYFYSKNMILLSKQIGARTLEQLLAEPAVKWGVIRGYRHSPEQDAFIEQLAKRGKVVMANDERDLYAMLSQSIVTAAFAHPFSYDSWLNSPALSGQVTVLDLFPSSERIAGGLMLAHSAFNQQQAEQWQAELQQMAKDGSLRKIFGKYLSADGVAQLQLLP
ncbi:transporter substrate-binding domain-containing protein [Chromobacterium alkanivorans]|uniref:substrate-binding periplasmic protein n=1 Tax=Chromobacterium alkanivorans TaxID=1071719 RepID=UPI001967A767|nr:transporter substrate-binding domain-containing protein [Chromobacterium alkanivorans]MBN3006521.1 transporter substrate-binding domain-containing protein [Chromobacterium alkanivorans]